MAASARAVQAKKKALACMRAQDQIKRTQRPMLNMCTCVYTKQDGVYGSCITVVLSSKVTQISKQHESSTQANYKRQQEHMRGGAVLYVLEMVVWTVASTIYREKSTV